VLGAFLLVEDDVTVSRSLARMLRAHGDVRVVGSVADAIGAIDAQPWVAILVDISLPDGSGLDIVEHARVARPTVPSLVLTGSNVPRRSNRAASLGARFVCKPCSAEDLLPFVLEAKSLAAGRDSAALEDLVGIAVARWTFSNREAEIFGAALRGTPRAEFLRASGMSPNTYKSHVRALLRKSDADSLATLALDLLREAAGRRSTSSYPEPVRDDARTVRLANRGDYAAFVRLFPELEIPDPVPSEEDFASRMVPRVLVAYAGEHLLGYAFWQAYGTTAHVVHLVVAPGARGLGTGELLLESVRDRAVAEGCVRWYLNVKKDNAVAIRLYERAGMRPELESVTTRLPWASVDSLGAAVSPGIEAFAPTPTDDDAIATVFGLDRERIALLRARPGYVLAALRDRRAAIVGFTAFDPSFPGAYPFRVARPELARMLLEALRPHARHADLIVAVEGDASLAHALVSAGARVEHELVRMGAALDAI
jgi:DNA-binding NarL/FixJ family response regulator/GNAT superfamily N-acetyltransferase